MTISENRATGWSIIFWLTLLMAACSGGGQAGDAGSDGDGDADGSAAADEDGGPPPSDAGGDSDPTGGDGDELRKWEEGAYENDSVPDKPFRQWRTEWWHERDGGITPLDVRSIVARPAGGVYIGASNGLFAYDPSRQLCNSFKRRQPLGEGSAFDAAGEGKIPLCKLPLPTELPEVTITEFDVQDLAVGEDQVLVIAARTNSQYGLFQMKHEPRIDTVIDCKLTEPAGSLAVRGQSRWIYIGTSGGVYHFNGNSCSLQATSSGWPCCFIIDIEGAADRRLAAINRQLVDMRDREFLHVMDTSWWKYSQDDQLIGGDLQSVAINPRGDGGEVWVSSTAGLQSIDRYQNIETHRAGPGGLPWDAVRKIAVAPDGAVWGTVMNEDELSGVQGLGAVYLDPGDPDGRWKVFHSRRWMAEDKVTAIGFDSEGGVWLGHPGGVTHLRPVDMTLKEKADRYLEALRERHLRLEVFPAACILAVAGELPTENLPETCGHNWDEHDGLWIGIQALAETVRANSALDEQEAEEARQNAWAIISTMLEMESSTPVSGLPASTLVPRDDFPSGEPDWNRSDKYAWRGNTDAASIVGHVLAYSYYYDLLATDGQKAKIARTIDAIANHVVTYNWKLYDLDEKPTDDGVWDEAAVGDGDGGGLRALELLALLRSAYHITGDAKYWDAYLERARSAGYAEKTRNQAAQSETRLRDHKANLLAFLSYLTLLRYEDIANFREIYIASLKNAWGEVRDERSQLFNIVYGVFMHNDFDLEEAVQGLRDAPLSLVDWRVDTCWRKDVALTEGLPEESLPEISEALPPDERKLTGLGGNPHECSWRDPDYPDRTGGHAELDPLFYLLPYWLGRNFDMIEASETPPEPGE